jgi:hypothetical protein
MLELHEEETGTENSLKIDFIEKIKEIKVKWEVGIKIDDKEVDARN